MTRARTRIDGLLTERLGGADAHAAVRRACAELLAEGGSVKPPIKLSTLAKHLGATIRYDNDAPLGSEEASLRLTDGKITLWVARHKFENPRTRSRARFSIAHEVGHLILFKILGPEFLDHADADGTAYSFTERLCDFAASEILMPRASLIDAIRQRGFSSNGFKSVARLFDVSLPALLKATADLVPDGSVIELRNFSRRAGERKTWRVFNTYTASAADSLSSWLPTGCTLKHISGLPPIESLVIDKPVAISGLRLIRGRSRVARDAVACAWPLVGRFTQQQLIPEVNNQEAPEEQELRLMLLVSQADRLDFATFGAH